MARIHTIQKSAKEHTCGRCATVLPKGSPYQKAAPGFRARDLIRCMSCGFRQSELTTSKLSEVYAAQEDLQANIDSWDPTEAEDAGDLETALQEAAERAREVAQEYTDANDGWTQNGASDNEQFTEKAETIEAWAEELENAYFEDKPDKPEQEDFEVEEIEDKDHAAEAYAEAIEAWTEEVEGWGIEARQAAQDACDALAV